MTDATTTMPVRNEQVDLLLDGLLTCADCDAVLRDPRFGRADPDRLYMTIGMPSWREHIGIYQWSTSMLLINPPDHTRLRRLVSGAFTARRVMALRPAVVALTERLLDGLAEVSGPVNFIDAFAFPLQSSRGGFGCAAWVGVFVDLEIRLGPRPPLR